MLDMHSHHHCPDGQETSARQFRQRWEFELPDAQKVRGIRGASAACGGCGIANTSNTCTRPPSQRECCDVLRSDRPALEHCSLHDFDVLSMLYARGPLDTLVAVQKACRSAVADSHLFPAACSSSSTSMLKPMQLAIVPGEAGRWCCRAQAADEHRD